MSISNQDLLMAILSMDSYNRGYDVKNPLSGDTIGTAKILNLKEDLGIDNEVYAKWQAAGFYAVAYQVNNETVISFRGTDLPFSLPGMASGGDVWNGWLLGSGDISRSQAYLATQFLAAVTTEANKGEVILTGHSLGGGLVD